jgi:2-isopropylmalate synthase
MGDTIAMLRDRVPNIDRAVISVHCHNDLGLAVANSLAAVEAGAGQIECTVNGIGERAGNCSLEEVVMAMRTRNDFYHCDTRIRRSGWFPPAGWSPASRDGRAAEQGDRRPERLRP